MRSFRPCCCGCSSNVCDLEEYQYEDTRSVVAGGSINCPVCAIGRTSARKQGNNFPTFQYLSYLDAGEMKPMYSHGENEEFSEAMGPGAFRDYGIYGNHLKIGHPCMDRWSRTLKNGHASPWFEMQELGWTGRWGDGAVVPALHLLQHAFARDSEAQSGSDAQMGVWNPFSTRNRGMAPDEDWFPNHSSGGEFLNPPEGEYYYDHMNEIYRYRNPAARNVWVRQYRPYEWLFDTKWDTGQWAPNNDWFMTGYREVYDNGGINPFIYNFKDWPTNEAYDSPMPVFPYHHYVNYDLPNGGEDVTFNSEYVWAFQNSWSNTCGFDGISPYELIHIDRGQREPGIKKLFPCDSNHAAGVHNYNVPTWYYETISPFGYLPFSPQFFDRWIHKFDGPLYPQGNCSMHCTERNIYAHKLAFVGSIGTFYQGYHDGSNSKRCVGDGRRNNLLYPLEENWILRWGEHSGPGSTYHSRATRPISPCDIIDFPLYQDAHWENVCSELGLPEEICNQNTIGFGCSPRNDAIAAGVNPALNNTPRETECWNCSQDSTDAIVTIPPDPGENYENWEWIRQWVNSGGKLVVLYSSKDIIDEGRKQAGFMADYQGSKYWIKNSSFPKSCGSWLTHEDTDPTKGMQEPTPSPNSGTSFIPQLTGDDPYIDSIIKQFYAEDPNTSFHGGDYVDESGVEELLYQFATYCSMSDEEFEESGGVLVPFYEGLCSQIPDDTPYFEGSIYQTLKETWCGRSDSVNFHPNQHDWNNRRMRSPSQWGYLPFYGSDVSGQGENDPTYGPIYEAPYRRYHYMTEAYYSYTYYYWRFDMNSHLNTQFKDRHRSFNGPSFSVFFDYDEEWSPIAPGGYWLTDPLPGHGGTPYYDSSVGTHARREEEMALVSNVGIGKQWPNYDYLGTHPYFWWGGNKSFWSDWFWTDNWFYGDASPWTDVEFNDDDRRSYLSSYFNFLARDYPTFLSCQKTKGPNTTKEGKPLSVTSMSGGDPLFPITRNGGKSLVGGNWQSFGGIFDYDYFQFNSDGWGDECVVNQDCPGYHQNSESRTETCFHGYCIGYGQENCDNECECSYSQWYYDTQNECGPDDLYICARGRCLSTLSWNWINLINGSVPDDYGVWYNWSAYGWNSSTANYSNKLLKYRRVIEAPFHSDMGPAATVYDEPMGNDIWPSFILEDPIVDNIIQNACSVVYKKHGDGAVIVSYDPSSLGTATNFPDNMFTNELDYDGNERLYQEENLYEFFENAGDTGAEQISKFAKENPTNFYGNDPENPGLTPKERRKHAANNDFWTFICQDFLNKDGQDPEWFEEYDEDTHGPRFWDYKGPWIGDGSSMRLAYKNNPCLEHLDSACCLPSGGCENLNPWECAERGGRWQGMRMMTNASDAYVEDGGNFGWQTAFNQGWLNEYGDCYDDAADWWELNGGYASEFGAAIPRIQLQGNYFFRGPSTHTWWNFSSSEGSYSQSHNYNNKILKRYGPGQVYTSRFSDFGFRARFKNYYEAPLTLVPELWYVTDGENPDPGLCETRTRELFSMLSCPYGGYVSHDPDPNKSCLKKCEDFGADYPSGPCDPPREGNCYYKCTDLGSCQRSLIGDNRRGEFDYSDENSYFISNWWERRSYSSVPEYHYQQDYWSEPQIGFEGRYPGQAKRLQDLFEPLESEGDTDLQWEHYLRNNSTLVEGITKVECAALATNGGEIPGPGGTWDLRNFNSEEDAENAGWFYWRPYVYGSCCTNVAQRYGSGWDAYWEYEGSSCFNSSDYECFLKSTEDTDPGDDDWFGEPEGDTRIRTVFRHGASCEEVICAPTAGYGEYGGMCIGSSGQYFQGCGGSLDPIGACCHVDCIDNVTEAWCENYTGSFDDNDSNPYNDSPFDSEWFEGQSCKEACAYGACCGTPSEQQSWGTCGVEEFWEIRNGCIDYQITQKGCEEYRDGTWNGDNTVCARANNSFNVCYYDEGECDTTCCTCVAYPETGPGCGAPGDWSEPCEDSCFFVGYAPQADHVSCGDANIGADYIRWVMLGTWGGDCDYWLDALNYIEQYGIIAQHQVSLKTLCEEHQGNCYNYCQDLYNEVYQGNPVDCG